MPDVTYYNSSLTGEQIENVLTHPVLTSAQYLTDAQKSMARSNIDAYQKPSNGIPGSDMSALVRQQLILADYSVQPGDASLLPAGGSTGQVLKKTSSSDYAVEWANESGGGGGAVTSVDGKTGAVTVLPTGGTPGQVLTKSTNADYAVAWGDGGGGGGAVTSVDGKTGAVNVLPSGGSAGQVLKKSSADNYAVEWAAESGGVPTPIPDDSGKVLTATSGGGFFWNAVPSELPSGGQSGQYLKKTGSAAYDTDWATVREVPSSTATDNGKVLKVVSGSAEWAAESTELPSVTTTDNGKVLTVVSGAWEAATSSGGGASVKTYSSYTVPTGSWQSIGGTTGVYYYAFEIAGVTTTMTYKTKVDLTLDYTALTYLIGEGVQAAYIENYLAATTGRYLRIVIVTSGSSAPSSSFSIGFSYYETV